jgi:hypothetical protein
LGLTEFTQIEILADKALVSCAFNGSSAAFNAGDSLMNEALFTDFQKRLLLLHYFNFFLNNPFDGFIAWTANLIHWFLFFRNFDRFLFNNSRGFNLLLNFRYWFFNFHFQGLLLLLDHLMLRYSDDLLNNDVSLLLSVFIVLLKPHDLSGLPVLHLVGICGR